MDYQTLRGVISAILLVMFLAVIWWAYDKRQKGRFDQAANSIFDDERPAKSKASSQESQQ